MQSGRIRLGPNLLRILIPLGLSLLAVALTHATRALEADNQSTQLASFHSWRTALKRDLERGAVSPLPSAARAAKPDAAATADAPPSTAVAR